MKETHQNTAYFLNPKCQDGMECHDPSTKRQQLANLCYSHGKAIGIIEEKEGLS